MQQLFSYRSFPHNFLTNKLPIFETSEFYCPLLCPSVLEEMKRASAMHRINQLICIYVKRGRAEGIDLVRVDLNYWSAARDMLGLILP